MTAASSTSTKVTPQDYDYYSFVVGRLLGMRINRYSWWTHWRELADYFLPRRYKWIVTPNQMARGSPINQHIIDDTGTFAARNLAAGIMSGKSSPTARWVRLRFNHFDATQTSPISRLPRIQLLQLHRPILLRPRHLRHRVDDHLRGLPQRHQLLQPLRR